VSQETLQGCIRVFLEQQGEDGRIVPLHELPVGRSRWRCGACARPMTRIALRGVRADRCESCRFLLLEPGAAALISRRVLVSARVRARLLASTRGRPRPEWVLVDSIRQGDPG
jgi:hypothetical protein